MSELSCCIRAVPATCVGISPTDVYAPNRLDLLYAGVLAINPLTPHRALYEAKARSYQQRWPWLVRAVELSVETPAP